MRDQVSKTTKALPVNPVAPVAPVLPVAPSIEVNTTGRQVEIGVRIGGKIWGNRGIL